MSTTPWKQQVRKYNDDTTFEQGPLNIPINDLIQRTDNLYERLNQVTDRNSMIIESVDISPDIDGCSVVYWNAEQDFYDRGKAVWSTTHGPNGELQIAESGMIQGIILNVPVDGVGDILTGGTYTLTDAQKLKLFGPGEPDEGLYFLSAVDEGTVTNVKPATPVPVLYYTGLNRITVAIGAPPEHNHIHKNYTMAEAWLGAANPQFDDMDIPAGAVWGYDRASDAQVDELFMTYPGDFVITVDGVIDGLFLVNSDNIWYMDAVDPNGFTDIQLFVSVPYNYGQPIIRAIQTTEDDLDIQGENGVVTINVKPWEPQASALSGEAVSYVNGREYGVTPVVSAIYPQGDSINVYKNPSTGEYVLSAGNPGIGNVYAEVVNLNNAMQVTDGDYILLTFPENRTSSMVGKIPVPKLNEISGFHYEIKAFAELKGMDDSGTFPEITVKLVYLQEATVSTPTGLGTPTIVNTEILEEAAALSTNKYYKRSEAAMSITGPGTVYVTLSMSDTGDGNKNLFDFGIFVELVAD